MNPVRLYIENFHCYEHAFIDFTEFSAAQIIGEKENSDLVSNGVGKTTIFKAIEYVLFNESDVPLEKIIRDDTNECRVVIDFMINDQEYRLARSRTRKGSADLVLLQRNDRQGSINEVYHTIKNDCESPFLVKKFTEKYWKSLSGSRAGDTEKDLMKLIKITHKAFVSTVLFPQNDMTGLSTLTPEKRKGILKDAFNLLVYNKLEEIAKKKSNLLVKEIDKHQLLIDNLGNPDKDLIGLSAKLADTQKILDAKNLELVAFNNEQASTNDKISELTSAHSNLEENFAALLSKAKTITVEKNKLEISVKEYFSKKNNVSKSANELVAEIKALKEEQIKLIEVDYSQIDILNESISSFKELIATYNASIKSNIEKYEDLKIPLPSGSMCKNCRKPMSDKERAEHNKHISKEMELCQEDIKKTKEQINIINVDIMKHQQIINALNLSKQQLESVNTKISIKNKEIQDKKDLYDEYSALFTKFTNELAEKNNELSLVQDELSKSSIDEAKNIKQQIDQEKQKITTIVAKIVALNKEINHYSGDLAITQHTIDQKVKDKLKKEELNKSIQEISDKLKTYPSVIQSFSSTGIPNLIIQNILDDIQAETNSLLTQLKPGLQLSFFVEKTRGDGDQADTLDIKYILNGKEKYYKQLSGGYQLAVAFSLKLGLSFVLQKMIGTDIKFLLLDEIDQSLDKASVDALVDIVKFFQKDFKIMLITHNDRLKDKFPHAILVKQDSSMVSKARVVSS